jgi:uncharacterized protein (DUF2237 family)
MQFGAAFVFFLALLKMGSSARNVLGNLLESCCTSPMTGYFRDGFCRTTASDYGTHIICAKITNKFLQFTLSRGNDLITPNPQYRFPGLVEGDKWCLCVLRWKEAVEHGVAPPIILESTHEKALEYFDLDTLRKYEFQSKEEL